MHRPLLSRKNKFFFAALFIAGMLGGVSILAQSKAFAATPLISAPASLFASAPATQQLPTNRLLNIFIPRITVVSQQGNTIKGTFSIKSDEQFAVPGITYAFAYYQGDFHRTDFSSNPLLLDEAVGGKVDVAAGKTQAVNFSFSPALSGNTTNTLYIVLYGPDGNFISQNRVAVYLPAVAGPQLIIPPQSRALLVGKDTKVLDPNIGVTLEASHAADLLALFRVENAGSARQADLVVNTYAGNITKPVGTELSPNADTVPANSLTDHKYAIYNKKASQPGQYMADVYAVDAQNPHTRLSNIVQYHYVIAGGNVTITGVAFNKTEYRAGDTALVTVSFLGRPYYSNLADNLEVAIYNGATQVGQSAKIIKVEPYPQSATLSFTLNADIVLPNATATIYENNQIIAQYSTMRHYASSREVLYGLGVLIILALIGGYFVVRDRRRAAHQQTGGYSRIALVLAVAVSMAGMLALGGGIVPAFGQSSGGSSGGFSGGGSFGGSSGGWGGSFGGSFGGSSWGGSYGGYGGSYGYGSSYGYGGYGSYGYSNPYSYSSFYNSYSGPASPYGNTGSYAGTYTISFNGTSYSGAANEWYVNGNTNGGTVSGVSASSSLGQALIGAGFQQQNGQVMISPGEVTLPNGTSVTWNGVNIASGGTVTITTNSTGGGTGGGGSSGGSYSGLSASCSASPNPAQAPTTVTYSAAASGGATPYSYSWSGAASGTNQTASEYFTAAGNYTAYLTVDSSDYQQASASCSDTVNPAPPPTVNISINPGSIYLGDHAVLSWNTTNAVSCTASGGWAGNQNTSGSLTAYPTTTTTYGLTCSNSVGNTISGSATVTVVPLTYAVGVSANIYGVPVTSTVAGNSPYPYTNYVIIQNNSYTTTLSAPNVYFAPSGLYIFSHWQPQSGITFSDGGLQGQNDTAQITVTQGTKGLGNYPTVTANYSPYAFNIDPTATPNSTTAGTPIQFNAGTSDNLPGASVSYLWNFGDGTTATAENPTHTYSKIGTFTISLTATDNSATKYLGNPVQRTAQVNISIQYQNPTFRENP